MGSSCVANGQSIDPTVGGLVWVRRRNGSWWPGRILGQDELPETCLVSPRRLGTPVKLLGREDASVDWYNLEKSKRVKAFRCGDYDACIEKAKVAATASCKKTVKYARRENAILQALELENLQLSEHKNIETASLTDKIENVSDKLSGLNSISISPRESSRTAGSADNSLEDDGTERSKKRMRGLEDLGVGRAVSSFKKKRTRVAHIHEFLKKKNRRRQLTKVLKKAEMVTVPVMCEGPTGLNGPGFTNVKAWGVEYNEFKGSFTDSTGDVTNDINADNCKQEECENSDFLEVPEPDDSSGRLFDVPFVRDEKRTAGPSPVPVTETGQSSLVETKSGRPDEFHETGSISSGADISHIMDNGTSNWQHKGKRNSRNKSKTKSLQKFFMLDDGSTEVNNTFEVPGPQKSMSTQQSRPTVNLKYQPLDLPYRRADTSYLFDVNIEVKTGPFPHHLPYVSISSMFTGQPVTGHSVEVEVMQEGEAVSDLSLNSSECLSSSSELGGVNMVNDNVEPVPETSRKHRKNGAVCNKKIRKLSSLTGSKRPSELKGTDYACVPLKVVFGRLYAALGISSANSGPAP